ncbi:lipopolysaccharide biosynthesis protein [Algoriphagus hitonicola]|uniref:Membrane protein involved in the export of O-antigen and teichoic acid n=1 Tax=Algoriphagus hitonicola TaxID=435880 RepID=A0A1I2XFZ7_9BACT|nr:polysaccharide biosynthesis C-terminal domain-containing protein [Algoriphagus hitonicola]SFH11977.1 Membrane protein involved in the export of O-antigen and teichoic acid [Algoriphagus hitonicola]
MGKVADQSIQTTIFSYLGVVIGYFNVLWLYPYALEASQLGTFRTIQDLALLFVPFAQLGLGHGITRYFPKLEQGQSAFLSFSLLLSLVGFLVVGLLFWIFQEEIISLFASNSPDILPYLWIVLLITFMALMNSILDAYSRSFLKVAIPTFFREVFIRILTGLWIVCFLMAWISFDQMMMGLIAIYGLPLLGMLSYLTWLRVLKLDFRWNNFPPKFRRSFLRFSLITFLATAASTLIMKIDSVMVSSMISLEANAIYTIAFSMALVIEMPRRAISQVVMPVIADHFSRNEFSEINRIYKQVSRRQLYICLLLFVGLWTNIDNIYHFIPNREIYESGKWVVFLIGLGKLFDVAFSVNSEILVFSKYYRFNLTATILMSISIIILNYLLIPIYGIEGAALASALVMLLFNLLKYFYLKLKLGFVPFDQSTLRILSIGVFSLIIVSNLPAMENPLLDMGIKSILIVAVYGIAARLKIYGQEELEWVRQKIKKPGS